MTRIRSLASIAEAAAQLAQQMGLKLVSTHAGFLPHEPSDPNFDKLSERVVTRARMYACRSSRISPPYTSVSRPGRKW